MPAVPTQHLHLHRPDGPFVNVHAFDLDGLGFILMWKIWPSIVVINFLLSSFSCQFDGEVNANVTVHGEETNCEPTKGRVAAMDPAEQLTGFRSPV